MNPGHLGLSMQQIDQRVDARLAEQSSAVQQLAIELDALDEANEVLRKVEADAGLHRPPHVLIAVEAGQHAEAGYAKRVP